MSVQTRVSEIVSLLMKRPITYEIVLQVNEFEEFQHLEITDGEWIGFEEDAYMTGEEHGWVETILIILIGGYVRKNKLGRVYPGDMDFVLKGSPDNIKIKRRPDVAFVPTHRLQKTSGYFYGAPDLAIEITSPNDRGANVQTKINQYLEHGTKVVWQVYPTTEQIVIYTPDGTSKTYKIGDVISFGEMIPGLELEVKEIFDL